jgi:DNA modification methylase
VSVELLHGDCVELMRAMPDCSVDSIVTDPPYELGFMGKAWDGAGIAYSLDMWGEALRVLKPGSHLLAFGGTRTYHRMACAIEDAGFEIRDSIHWVYGSGFPKSLNIGKAIDKRGGSIPWQAEFAAHLRDVKPKGVTTAQINAHVAENGSKSNFWGHFIDVTSQPLLPTVGQYLRLRELLPIDPVWDEQFLPEAEREVVGTSKGVTRPGFAGDTYGPNGGIAVEVPVTAPATAEAARWEGWGTALKPAHEPIVVARKPLSGTVAGNVLVWGTGGLNIDGCRVPSQDGYEKAWDRPVSTNIGAGGQGNYISDGSQHTIDISGNKPEGGRWPANIVLDGAAAAALDQQSGWQKDGKTVLANRKREYNATSYMITDNREGDRGYGGEGGASRFFTQADFGPDDWPFVYQAKPSKRERNAGLDGLPLIDRGAPAQGMQNMDGGRDRMRQNHHPTVKPVALMRHLVRLVTPPGGTVLDPFAGSGTTLVAAVLEGFDAIGCEMTDEYLPIIRGRVAWAEEQADAEQPRLL